MAPVGNMEIQGECGRRIKQFFEDQGYTEETLSRLGLEELPLVSLPTQSPSFWELTGDLRLDFSIRLFYFGEVVVQSEAGRFVPQQILDDLLTIGILRREGERLYATCMLTHFGEMILASDSRQRTVQAPTDLVLGVNPTTRLLAHCSMLRPGAKALDLGTGCGTLALSLARSADSVVANDINPRALNFGKMNAALNGVGNVTFMLGDRFDPVGDSRFDAILCNPPFFLAPVSGLLYCESGMELDRFVESLARSATRFLEENGVFQMLCEWVEFASEPWEQRLKPWFEGSHCDIHVWQGYEFSPEDYARKRALEQGHLNPESVVSSFGERVFYLREHRVKRILGGLISMRRRAGPNWFWVEEMQKRPAFSMGNALWERFMTRDLLEASEEQILLGSRPRLAGQIRLVSEAVPRDGFWSTERSYLERTDGLPAKLGLDLTVSQLVARFDGTKTLITLLTELASEQRAPLDGVIPEGLRIIKQLGTAGFILLH